MKKKTIKIRWNKFKYLLFLPILLLTFCDSNLEGPNLSAEKKLTKDAKVLTLMKSAIQSDSDQNLAKNKSSLSKSTSTEEDNQCTHFLYPMTFEVYTRDNIDPVLREINSDEELSVFIDTLIASTTNYEFYIYFPITLLDSDGVETEINDLTALEGTLQMAVDACASFNDEPSGDDGDDDESSGDNEDNEETSDDNSDDDESSGDNEDNEETSDDNSDDDGSSDDNEDNDESSDDDGDDDGSSGDNEDDDESSDDDGDDDGSSGDNEDDDESSDDDESDDSNDGSNNDQNTEDDKDKDDSDESCGKKNKKVYICHKGVTICVSVNAIWGHMQHHEDDYLGSCDD